MASPVPFLFLPPAAGPGLSNALAMAPAGGVAGQAEVFGGEQGQHGLLLTDYTSNECVHRDKQTELRGVCSQPECGGTGQIIAAISAPKGCRGEGTAMGPRMKQRTHCLSVESAG